MADKLADLKKQRKNAEPYLNNLVFHARHWLEQGNWEVAKEQHQKTCVDPDCPLFHADPEDVLVTAQVLLGEVEKLTKLEPPTVSDVFMDDDEVKVIITASDAYMTLDLCFETKEDYEKFRAALKPYDVLKEEHEKEF